jgi:hypothetical protein
LIKKTSNLFTYWLLPVVGRGMMQAAQRVRNNDTDARKAAF